MRGEQMPGGLKSYKLDPSHCVLMLNSPQCLIQDQTFTSPSPRHMDALRDCYIAILILYLISSLRVTNPNFLSFLL